MYIIKKLELLCPNNQRRAALSRKKTWQNGKARFVEKVYFCKTKDKE